MADEDKERGKRVTVSPSDLVPVDPIPHLNLPDIKEVACHKYTEGGYYVFDCEPVDKFFPCPTCGEYALRKHGKLKEPRLIHDVNVGVDKIDILLKAPRYLCTECGASTTFPFESIVEKRQMTQRLYDQIRRDSFVRTFAEVAAAFGYSDTTITNIFDEYAEELESKRQQVLAPRVLGIDEKHIVHDQRGMYVDIENGTLLEMTEDNKRKSVISTIESFKDYDTRIKIVTMDMAGSYQSYVHECLPNADIIIDKYHVFQEMTECARTTKKAISDYLEEQLAAESFSEDKWRKMQVLNMVSQNPYLFRFGPEKLEKDPNRLKKLADACKAFPEFNFLRLLKTGFEKIYDCTDRASAEDAFEEWLKFVPPLGSQKIAAWEKQYGVPALLYNDFRRIRDTMLRRREDIFHYFELGRFTNAATEGLNQLVDKMNAMGNGYSFKRLRAKALFWHIADPRITYVLASKSVPIYEAVNSFTSVTRSLMRPSNEGYSVWPSRYTTQLSIDKLPPIEKKPRKPLSVFKYLPSDFVPY